MQIGLLARQNQELWHNGKVSTTNCSEYNREKEMWKIAKNRNRWKQSCWRLLNWRVNQRYCYRYWRRRTAEGRGEEDENSIFVPNVAFTQSCETNWRNVTEVENTYDQMRFGQDIFYRENIRHSYFIIQGLRIATNQWGFPMRTVYFFVISTIMIL